jgi:predicted secreted protein
MTGFLGRSIALTWDGASVAGVREKKKALSGAAVDVTSDEDNGWRTLLEDPQQNEVNLSLSGVTKSDVLRSAWFSGDRTATATLTYPDGGVLSGTFYLATYNETGPYNNATTFDCELQSSGAVTYTPGT